ncbi:MAG: TlpA family protein disulfide reductase [Spirochaetes bacterium]|nr:TlpA family protein disulfide reductase [Spirochaetota bacterium]
MTKITGLTAILLLAINIFINAAELKPETKKLIEKMGGGMPKKEIKFIDANITDMNGNKTKISDFKDKVIFLNLWATWCPPCRAEMPSMEKLHNKFKDKEFVILAVSQGENMKTVENFLKKNKYSFKIFTDDKNEVASSYGTGSIPTSYLIDKNGNMIAQFVGGRDWFSKEAVDLINALL